MRLWQTTRRSHRSSTRDTGVFPHERGKVVLGAIDSVSDRTGRTTSVRTAIDGPEEITHRHERGRRKRMHPKTMHLLKSSLRVFASKGEMDIRSFASAKRLSRATIMCKILLSLLLSFW